MSLAYPQSSPAARPCSSPPDPCQVAGKVRRPRTLPANPRCRPPPCARHALRAAASMSLASPPARRPLPPAAL